MAVPKKKRSKSKKRTKHACWKIKPLGLRPCPQCKSLGVSHQVCAVCGTYKGKQVIVIKEKKEKATTEDS